MTIAEKSTELGIDLAQIALDNNPIYTCMQGDVFHCYYAGGKVKPIDVYDNNGVLLSDTRNSYFYSTESFTESTPLATIEADFKSWYNAKEFFVKPVSDDITPKE